MDKSEADVERLISLAYEAVLDDGALQRLVHAMDRHLDGAYVQIHAHDQDARTNLGGFYAHHPDEFMQQYVDYYERFNPVTPHLLAAPIGQLLRTEQLVDMEALKASEYYNDWLLPQEDSAIGTGAVLLRDSGRMLIAGIHLRAKDVEHKMDKAQHLLRRLNPHLVRVMELRRGVARLRGAEEGYRHLLDTVPDVVVHLDNRAKVIWMNKAGEWLCAHVPGFRVDAWARLHTGDSAMDGRILETCQARHMQVRTVILDCRQHIGALVAGHVMGAPELGPGWGALESEVCATLTLHMAGQAQNWHSVVQHFALSPAEAALAHDLVRGATLEECAAARNTSIHTVRNQLRALLGKTDTNRQSELVGLLAPFAPLAGEEAQFGSSKG